MNNLKVLVNDDAKKYINEKSKDNSITITIKYVGSGWRPEIKPSVMMGKPMADEEFDLVNADGIDVYIKKDIKSRKNEIKVSLEKFLWTKYLIVEGVNIM